MIKTVIFVGFILFGVQFKIIADEPMPTTETLEQLVKEWVDLRQEIAAEKKNWNEQKAQLKQENELLSKEKQLLQQEIEQAIKTQTQEEIQWIELVREKKVFQEVLDKSLTAINEAEADLKKWQFILPASLIEPLKSSFDDLKLKEKPVSQRMRIILTLYGAIEDISRNVHLVKETLETNLGVLQEMDVLYLGLAQGFAVSTDNKVAGIGLPGEDGWQWSWRNEIANEVRRSIEYYKMERVADFVELPLKIKQ